MACWPVTQKRPPESGACASVVRIGQILGRKNVYTDAPTERIDAKILETLIELDKGQRLPVGLRVSAYIIVE